jgi:hypothetical protein
VDAGQIGHQVLQRLQLEGFIQKALHTQRLQQRQVIRIWQPVVEHDRIEVLCGRRLKRARGVAGFSDRTARFGEGFDD